MDKYKNNYNLEDEDIRYFILGKIISGKLIDFYGLKIKHITVDEIWENSEEWFNNLLKPFLFNKDVWGLNDDFGLLEVFFLISHEQIKSGEIDGIYEDLLKDSLSYFFRIDREMIRLEPMGKEVNIVIGRDVFSPTLMMDSNRFEELRKIILLEYNDGKEIHKSDLNKKDELDIKLKEGNSKGFNKLLEAEREEEKDKNRTSRIFNIYNYVVSKINPLAYDEVSKLTIYQLYNSYINTQIDEDNNFTLQIASNGMGSEDMKIVPFTKRIEK